MKVHYPNLFKETKAVGGDFIDVLVEHLVHSEDFYFEVVEAGSYFEELLVEIVEVQDHFLKLLQLE